MENSISITIPPQDLQAVKDMLATIQGILEPYLIALTPEDRRRLLKMGDGSEPFVAKVMDYAVTDPQFLPPFVPLAEMNKDWEAVSGLLPIFRTVQQLQSNLSDTVMLTGSEAFEASLSYYNSVKMAARMNVPNAKTIYEDLSKRWEAQGRRKTQPEAEL
ncbi:hypothetical protein SAMN00777080_2775 [Aquiflexum balticum DSM 16537]|jgi:hypothetical protein|uniref:Uncharacterized protein n=1 Tax=Aquiflexum balticum DSM 16537 TaxID=758820 RepID=A0A1W2H5D4_9BACT|nr:hypothetical protein [Aquiflexum balticum]SMD44160.1 hypothetical protein SAMN00777080_2775 [Aquiflexum balticum DSM 16537]